SQSCDVRRPSFPVDRGFAAAAVTIHGEPDRLVAMIRSFDRMNRGEFLDPSPLRPAIPRCARRSLWFGSIRRTELIIPSSVVFAMFDATRLKMFNREVHHVVAQKWFFTIALCRKICCDCQLRLNSCD